MSSSYEKADNERKLKLNARKALKSACIVKPFKSFTILKVGSYFVEHFERVSSSSSSSIANVDERIRVDFFEFFMYLPPKFSSVLNDKLITELNGIDTSVVMIYSGKSADGRLLLDFDILKYDVDIDVF